MFKTDGVFRVVNFPPIPVLNATVSANAREGIWQLAQLIELSLESVFSLKSFFPKAIFAFLSLAVSPIMLPQQKMIITINGR